VASPGGVPLTLARPAAFVAYVLCGLLAACGSPAPASSGEASTLAATAAARSPTPFIGTDFSTVVPGTWTNRLSVAAEVARFSGGGKVEFLVEQGPPGQPRPNVNDVTANINVLLLGAPVPDDQLGLFLQTVSNNGATNLSSPQPVTIGGASGQFITYDRNIQGTPGESQDIVVNHGANTYDIVLNTSRFAFSSQLPAMEAVVAAWHWAS
jgi:hypothetical protein